MFRRYLAAVSAVALLTASAVLAADGIDPRDANGSTPLLVAASNDDAAQVRQLLKAGANPNVRNKLDTTPLLEAAFHSNTEMIKALLDAGADPNAAGADGQTPLMLVARGTNVVAAKMLLDKGANPNGQRVAAPADGVDVGRGQQPGTDDAAAGRARRGRRREDRDRPDDAAGQRRAACAASFAGRHDGADVRVARRLPGLRRRRWWRRAPRSIFPIPRA